MKLFRKMFCFLLAALLLFLTAGAALAADTETLPIVYIRGQGETIRAADGTVLYEDGSVPVPDALIEDAISDCMPYFARAVMFGRWDAYREKLLSYWRPVYEPLALENGEVRNGAYVDWTWDKNDLKPDFVMHSYYFGSDWRLDPFDNADILHDFIQDVKEVTGAKQVNVVARCEGANIAAAYFVKYGYQDIRCLELYIPALEGIDMIGAAFSGEIAFTPALLETYYRNRVSFDDDTLHEFIDALVEYLTATYSSDAACELINRQLPTFYEQFINDMILTSYGMFPGIWSLVGPEYYAQARAGVFRGREREYAGLIEKLDRYDTLVRRRYGDVLKEARDNGVKIAVIAKYGEYTYQTPFCKEAAGNLLNDDTCSLAHASLGASCAVKDRTLDDARLSGPDARFISPDLRVDAATCLLPEQTWIVYQCEHSDFPSAVNQLLRRFFETDGAMTVFSDPAFPQYLTYTGASVVPMSAQDVPAPDEPRNELRLLAVIRRYFRMIASFFKMISALIGG